MLTLLQFLPQVAVDNFDDMNSPFRLRVAAEERQETAVATAVSNAANYEVNELERLLARRGSLSEQETARVQTLMRRNSSTASVQQSSHQGNAGARAQGEDLNELGRLLARTGNLSAEETARVRTLMRRNSANPGIVDNTSSGKSSMAEVAAAAVATVTATTGVASEGQTSPEPGRSTSKVSPTLKGSRASSISPPPLSLPPSSPSKSVRSPVPTRLSNGPSLAEVPSCAGQEVLYALLQLFEEAPWLVVGVGKSTGSRSNGNASRGPETLSDTTNDEDSDDAPCVAGGPFPTRGSLRAARVIEVLCSLIPLGSLDTANVVRNNSHPGDSSGSGGSKSTLLVGQRALASDSREVRNFGGIDLAARAKHCLLKLLEPAWIAAWCPNDPGAGFVAISSVVLRTLARHLLHPPPAPSTAPSRAFFDDSATVGPFSAYVSEARGARELLSVLNAVLVPLNAHAASARQPFGSLGAFGTGFGASFGHRRSTDFSLTPTRTSVEAPWPSSSTLPPLQRPKDDEESDRTRFEARRRVLAAARASAVAACQSACLVQLCSPAVAVCTLAARCMTLLCDQGDLLDSRASASASVSLAFADFSPRYEEPKTEYKFIYPFVYSMHSWANIYSDELFT